MHRAVPSSLAAAPAEPSPRGPGELDLEAYERDGFSAPVRVLEEGAAGRLYRRFFRTLGQRPEAPRATSAPLSGWHLRARWAYDLATHPRIRAAMTEILGPDLVLWAMHFWYKEPGSRRAIPWHQDWNYWPMEPAINATCWLSLGRSDASNGGLRLVPGSHRRRLPHVELASDASGFRDALAPSSIDERHALDLALEPGEACFFNEHTVHGSGANLSPRPRVALSIRYTTPEVRFDPDRLRSAMRGVRTLLVQGVDRHRHNEAIRADPPGTAPA